MVLDSADPVSGPGQAAQIHDLVGMQAAGNEQRIVSVIGTMKA